jgi:prepilin peptidase CpaA
MMMPRLEVVPVAAFAALMIEAAIVDLRRRIIPNAIVAAVCLLWPVDLAITRSIPLVTALETAGGAGIVFAAGALLFARGLLGGGDVKLLAAVSLWAGVDALPALLILTAIFGGVLALAALSPLVLARLGGGGRSSEISQRSAALGAPIPYGVAIAGAALVVTIPLHLA